MKRMGSFFIDCLWSALFLVVFDMFVIYRGPNIQLNFISKIQVE